jgi:flagellar biosynthesis protein FlhG
MKSASTSEKGPQVSEASNIQNRLAPVLDQTSSEKPVAKDKPANGSPRHDGLPTHRITKTGLAFDKEYATAAPDMTKPLLNKPTEGSTADISPVAILSSSSHEVSSLIGKTLKLELRKAHAVKSVALISNKGGVGKTHISTNMAFNLARLGKRGLLIDLDLGNADVSNKLGYYCEHTVMDLLNGKFNVEGLIYSTPLGFDMIGGESGNFRLANLNATQKKRFIKAFNEIGNTYDFVIYDLSAGIGSTTLDFALAQDYQIIVTTPQDIVAGYACIKAAFYRFQELEKKMAEQDPNHKMRTTFRPFVVLNQVETFEAGRALYDKMKQVVSQNLVGDRKLHLEMNFLGAVTSDQMHIREAELDHFLFSNKYGASRTGQCFHFLVKNMVQYRDPDQMTFTTKLKRLFDIFMRSVEETNYAQ